MPESPPRGRLVRWVESHLDPEDVYEIESMIENAGWIITRRATFQGVCRIEFEPPRGMGRRKQAPRVQREGVVVEFAGR